MNWWLFLTLQCLYLTLPLDVMIFSLTHPPNKSNIKKLLLCNIGWRPVVQPEEKKKMENHFKCIANALQTPNK